jgi:hypothetical protein
VSDVYGKVKDKKQRTIVTTSDFIKFKNAVSILEALSAEGFLGEVLKSTLKYLIRHYLVTDF